MTARGERSRARAGFGVAVGAVAVVLGVALRTERSLEAAWCGVALALVIASTLAAWVTKPERDPALLLGTALIALLLAWAMPVFALLEPAVRTALIPAALETAGGLAIYAGAIRWSQANAKRALEIFVLDPNKKVRVLRQKKKVEIATSALVAGDELHLSGGDDVPVDGVVIEGSGFVDEMILTGPTLPVAKKPGDVILAGSENTSIPELAIRVETPLGDTVLAQREALLPLVIDDLARLSRIDVAAFALAALLSIARALLVFAKSGADHVELYLPSIAALALAGGAGPALLAAIRGRLRMLALARASGLIITRARDLLALPRVRRWQIDASLLAAPGEVEAVAFAGERPDHLLRIAAALLAEEEIPEAISLREAAKTKKLERLAAAAVRRQGSLYLGTVEGGRWYLGPPGAVVEEEGVKLDKVMEGPINFLRDRSMITWLIGTPGGEIAGAIGIALEADLDAKTAAQRLGATIMPGPPDATRLALSKKANIRCDGPPVGRRDATILAEHAAPPSSGLRIRVSPIRTRIVLEEDRSPRLFVPSLGGLGELLGRARRALWSARLRTFVLAIAPPLAAGAIAFVGSLWPIAGAALALFALAFAGPVKERNKA